MPMPNRELLATAHMYAAPVALFLLSSGSLIVVSFAGYAMLQGTLEAASFVAVATGFFGLLGGALGISSQRSQGRAGDTGPTPPAPTITTEVTSGETTARTTAGAP